MPPHPHPHSHPHPTLTLTLTLTLNLTLTLTLTLTLILTLRWLSASPTAEGRTPIELCVMQSVSPAYNPRQTWSAETQQKRGYDDQWARRPAALYPWKVAW